MVAASFSRVADLGGAEGERGLRHGDADGGFCGEESNVSGSSAVALNVTDSDGKPARVEGQVGESQVQVVHRAGQVQGGAAAEALGGHQGGRPSGVRRRQGETAAGDAEQDLVLGVRRRTAVGEEETGGRAGGEGERAGVGGDGEGPGG